MRLSLDYLHVARRKYFWKKSVWSQLTDSQSYLSSVGVSEFEHISLTSQKWENELAQDQKVIPGVS